MTTEQGYPGYAGAAPWMGTHPDIVALRERFDLTAESARSQMIEGLLLLTGLWAAISPWVVGFRSGAHDLAVNDLIIGLAVAALAFSYGTMFGRSHRLAWITPLLGVWLIIAQWVMQDVTLHAGTIASNVVTGAVVAVLGLAATGLVRVAIGPRGMAAATGPAYAPATGTPGTVPGAAPGEYPPTR